MSDLFHEDVRRAFYQTRLANNGRLARHTFQILTKRPKRMASILKDTRQFEVLSNVWLGVSIEDSKVIDRLDSLRETPAKIRFASFEPLIGSVKTADLSGIDWAIVGGESGPQARTMNEQWVNEIYELCKEHHTAFFFKQWGGKNKKLAGRSYRGRLWDALPELRCDRRFSSPAQSLEVPSWRSQKIRQIGERPARYSSALASALLETASRVRSITNASIASTFAMRWCVSSICPNRS